MIRPNDSGGSDKPPLSAAILIHSIELELAKKHVEISAESQELYYDALESTSPEEELSLIQKSLSLDPGNIDSLLRVLSYCGLRPEEDIEVLRRMVALGERRLGAKVFQELTGNFWGSIETRPYMRARQQLAETLQDEGRIEESLTEAEAMLKLNPRDNQGMRYSLLTGYLALHRLDEARRLFQQHQETEWNTAFAWGHVLERWLSHDLAGAETALTSARKQNPHTEFYLRKRRRLPKSPPRSYSPGERNEALAYASNLLTAWSAHPEAQDWLSQFPLPPKP